MAAEETVQTTSVQKVVTPHKTAQIWNSGQGLCRSKIIYT